MDIESLDSEMSKANEKAQEWALEVATWRSQSEYLDEMKKTILAQLCAKYDDLAVNQRELKARAEDAYITHLQGVKEAKFNYLKAVAKRDRYEKTFERLRSKLSAIKIRDRF